MREAVVDARSDVSDMPRSYRAASWVAWAGALLLLHVVLTATAAPLSTVARSHGYLWPLLLWGPMVLVQATLAWRMTGRGVCETCALTALVGAACLPWGHDGARCVSPWTDLAGPLSGLLGDVGSVVLWAPLLQAALLAWGLAGGAGSGRRAMWTAMAVAAVWYGTLAVSGLVPPTQPGARSAGCSQNLKQIGYALQCYALEHDGCMPPTTDAEAFLAALSPWIRIRDCFACPPQGGGPWSLVPYASRRPGQYALVGRQPKRLLIHGSPSPQASLPPYAFGAQLAAERVLMADGAPRHKGGRYCLYYDDHVKWLPEEQVMGAAGIPAEHEE